MGAAVKNIKRYFFTVGAITLLSALDMHDFTARNKIKKSFSFMKLKFHTVMLYITY